MSHPFRSRHPGILLLLSLCIRAWANEPGMDFFEARIRPILADHCYSCHSTTAAKAKGGLKLDTRESLLKGGDTGPALKAGDVESSLLIRAVRYTDDNLQMPPKGKKLTSAQISDLEAWVRMGAPDPRTGLATPSKPDPSLAAARHWAFQRVQTPPPPAVRNQRWVETSVDAFVLASLEARHLTPSASADRRTLIRRATFDLTGLPPTPEEVESFLTDRTPWAWEHVVDRLLASPRYGERWGRYWLDTARYADTKGYVFEEERRYAYAYTYRDYVIRAFNEDIPFDRFIQEQLAADQLDLGKDQRPLAAMGFLTLGRRFLNSQPDIIDDRLDVVFRGLMGLTIGCARCHDHKYDPISMRDYYSLYGVFASTHEPEEKPLLGEASLPPAYPDYLKEHDRRQKEHDTFRAEKHREVRAQLRQRIGDYLLTAHEAAKLGDESKAENLARERKLDPTVAQRWRNQLDAATDAHPSILAPWRQLSRQASTGGSNAPVDVTAALAALTTPVHPHIRHALEEPKVRTLDEAARRYNELFARIDNAWLTQLDAATNGPAPTGLAAAGDEAIRAFLYASNHPATIAEGEIARMLDVPSAQKLRRLKRQLEELDATHAGAPPRGMVLAENPTPSNGRVFIRGNPSNPGAEVPRRFLAFLHHGAGDPPAFTHGSGRIDLARAITSRENPLTARVFVNRVWLRFFGNPLVRTPADFGVRTEAPIHPGLLDHLAGRFMEEGWSVKKLHRLVLLSNTYRQSSEPRPQLDALDPSNNLLARANRRRLDLEAMRDSILAASGSLDTRITGGLPADLLEAPYPTRRTIFGFIERQNLPGFFRTFDFASPDTTTAQRFTTTVPQQALFLMNSPFMAQQARELAKTAASTGGTSVDGQLRALHRRLYQRDPDRDERQLARGFLSQASQDLPPEPADAWTYGTAGVSADGRRTEAFTPLPTFLNQRWQGGTNFPDKGLGHAMLDAKGGHPGPKPDRAVVRRWTSPNALTVRITGTLNHPGQNGDGVRARLISSRSGLLATWIAEHQTCPTDHGTVSVQPGETLDFLVDCREGDNSDSFEWSVRLTTDKPPADGPALWDSRADFGGPRPPPTPPLAPFERYAQTLMLANEFFFVD